MARRNSASESRSGLIGSRSIGRHCRACALAQARRRPFGESTRRRDLRKGFLLETKKHFGPRAKESSLSGGNPAGVSRAALTGPRPHSTSLPGVFSLMATTNSPAFAWTTNTRPPKAGSPERHPGTGAPHARAERRDQQRPEHRGLCLGYRGSPLGGLDEACGKPSRSSSQCRSSCPA